MRLAVASGFASLSLAFALFPRTPAPLRHRLALRVPSSSAIPPRARRRALAPALAPALVAFALVAGLPFGPYGMALGSLGAIGACWARDAWRRGQEHRRILAVRVAVADAADLVAMAAGAGLNVFRSLEVAAAAAREEVKDELRRVVDGVLLGRPLDDGLADLSRRVPLEEVSSLARTIASCSRRGGPLAEPVERVADEIRASIRHAGEEAARVAPVKMLFPLAFLVLPSFLLLSAVPLLVVAFRQVRI